MGEKQVDKSTSRPVSDNPEDGTWAEIDCETETGSFAIITDVLPPEAAPKLITGGETARRRTLDDMRRLSEEIRRKRQSGG
jgi:hypothetical protein